MAKRPKNFNGHSPLGQASSLVRHGDFKIEEVDFAKQIKLLGKAIEQTERQIKKLCIKKYRFPSKADEIELRIQKKEQIYKNQRWRMEKLKRKQDSYVQRYKTRQENLAKEMQAHIKKLEKTKPIDPFTSGLDAFRVQPKPEREEAKKPKVKRQGTKIFQVKKKRWSGEGHERVGLIGGITPQAYRARKEHDELMDRKAAIKERNEELLETLRVEREKKRKARHERQAKETNS